jgi:plasmid maintenance system antidote protein VapI
MKHQKTQRENPFQKAQLKKPGVVRATSRRRSINKLQNISQTSLNDRPENDVKHKRLDVDALVIEPANIDVQINRGFVNVPQNKEALHPARYFYGLYLSKATAKGLSIQEIIDNLDISEGHFDDFLNEKVSVDIGFAEKLELVTGMPFDFWLRTQYKFDNSNNDDLNKAKF